MFGKGSLGMAYRAVGNTALKKSISNIMRAPAIQTIKSAINSAKTLTNKQGE